MKTTGLRFSLLTLFFICSLSAQSIPGLPTPNKADPSAVPDSYAFSWKYKMEIQTDNGKSMNAEYLLQPGAEYFGMNMAQAGGMLMIMDNKNKLTVTTFNKGAEKMAMASKMPDYSKVAAQKSLDKFTYKSLPEKTILGYKCKGVEANNSSHTMIFYFTNDAPVNFADMFKSPQSQKMPNAFKDYFKPGDKPLMLSVEITDKTTKKTTSLKCLSLEKSAFTFKKADYKFM